MIVVVTGGTGQIGRHLVPALRARGDSAVVFTRDAARARTVLGDGVRYVRWDPSEADGPWVEALAEADAVVNLAGEPVEARRWDEPFKRALRESRIGGTRRLIAALERSTRRPRAWINASATHFYGPVEQPTEENGAPGTGFVPRLMADWEHEARAASALGLRTVLLRIGWVLTDRGGGLEQQFPLFKLYLGGPLGGGQWVPWIHVEDMVGLALRALDDDAIEGPINCVAPNPVRMRDFAREVGRVLRRPSWLAIPPWLVHRMVGPVAEIILDGANARPGVARRVGYAYRYERLGPALEALHRGAAM